MLYKQIPAQIAFSGSNPLDRDSLTADLVLLLLVYVYRPYILRPSRWDIVLHSSKLVVALDDEVALKLYCLTWATSCLLRSI